MSNLSEAISEMRNMRESYDQIGAAAEAYNVGKTQLAQAITSKGVDTSPTETYPEMAEKVNAISQETYEINGGEMYAKQLFGSLETPNYWNLYDVLAQLLSDGRLVNYGGILLAEYYRGYDSLALSGAGAGGAYVVSDKDENGQFKMYTEDTTHTWATEFDGKGNRWVAYCFADEYHDFQITDTNTSPRSIFIGRKVGTIASLVNGRVSQIVVPDGSKLRSFESNEHTQQWNKHVVIRNVEINSSPIIVDPINTESIYIQIDTIGSRLIRRILQDGTANIKTIIIEANNVISSVPNIIPDICGGQGSGWGTTLLVINGVSGTLSPTGYGGGSPYLKTIVLDNVEEFTLYYSLYGGLPNHTLIINYKPSVNDKTKQVAISGDITQANFATDVILKDGWCKPLNISLAKSLTKENVQAHIFDRLGVNDISTGAVTITLANAVLNLFTQEEIDAVVERTNITIVGA